MRPWTEERMDEVISVLLRTGVLIATALVAAGAAITLAGHAGDPVDFRVFRGEPLSLRSPLAMARGALALQGPGLVQLGLLVLLATPVARVAFSVFAFAAQRDWAYIAITLLVLAVLSVSLMGG